MFWGLTPALDLQEEINTHAMLNSEVNILLVGGADCRHILKTLAKRYTHEITKLNFYVVEACPETIAKQLFLLYIALQSEKYLGLVQKVRYFMEIYGNMIIRPAISDYLKTNAAGFVNLITDYSLLNEVMPFVTIDVRYKERDYIENLYKFWCGSDEFDIDDCWDRRLRKSLGIRYDNKTGAFDWDLHMRYHSVGGNMISSQEYHSFRSRGVAFSWLESEASRPNRSMVCGVIPNGNSFLHYGYMGDIITGPFVAYGLDCADKEMLKKTNNINHKRSTDITEWNLREIFHEIHNATPYAHKNLNDLNLGTLVTNLNNLGVVDSSVEGNTIKTPVKKCIDLPNVTINFRSVNFLQTLDYKEKYHEFFDMIYFNFNYMKYFNGSVLNKTTKPYSLLYIENQLFVLSNREMELDTFRIRVIEKLDAMRYSPIKFNPNVDQYFTFLLNSD